MFGPYTLIRSIILTNKKSQDYTGSNIENFKFTSGQNIITKNSVI